MPNTIVVPLDLSRQAEVALPLAQSLAKFHQAEVKLVSVQDLPVEFTDWIRQRSSSDRVVAAEDRRLAYLNEIAATFEDIPVEAVVLHGHPAVEVVSYTNKQTEPLIVLNRNRQTGLRIVLRKRTHSRIIQGAKCPVITVSATELECRRDSISDFKTILVPMGGSLYAESALDEVIKVFGGSYATFHLLRIIEPITGPQLYYDDDELPIDLAKAYIDSRFSDAEEYLAEQAEALRRDGLSATSEVNVGPVADAILDSWEADLIALASHGQTGARWFGMGSVAGRVLAEATVPVLMVGARSM